MQFQKVLWPAAEPRRYMPRIINSAVVLFIGIFPFGTAVGCTAPTGDLAHDHTVLVEKTPVIVFATATSVAKARGVPYASFPAAYTFRVIRVLKGSIEEEFSIKGDASLDGLWDTTFEDHNDEKRFWIGKSGRLGNIGDCITTPPPGFILRVKYLLFIGGPDDSKRYERIDSVKDKWLAFVEQQLKD